ncbi:hypothetical protein CE91St46_13720 [Eubacteriales bacterium]|nr:hypothetical protein CE91St46_13720 [Eubacteriales bacterium]GKH62898.1 hypothetical protein CE91St47_13670 [Eubacteriales bacterium]
MYALRRSLCILCIDVRVKRYRRIRVPFSPVSLPRDSNRDGGGRNRALGLSRQNPVQSGCIAAEEGI